MLEETLKSIEMLEKLKFTSFPISLESALEDRKTVFLKKYEECKELFQEFPGADANEIWKKNYTKAEFKKKLDIICS